MPDPTLDDHEIAFTKWWKDQGDTSDTPLYMMVRKAYFEGAKYGSECILKAYREGIKEFGNEGS